MSVKETGKSKAVRVFLKDQAYDAIKQAILAGELEAGSLVSERSLAELLGMGKAPVRDAISRLNHEEYLTVSAQQGIVVRPFSRKDIADTFEARLTIEPQIAFRLAGHLSDAARSRLEANLSNQSLSIKDQNTSTFLRLDIEFHIELLQAHGNRVIVQMMERICERTTRVIALAFDGKQKHIQRAFQQHQAILQAILSGDAALAEKQVSTHIDSTKKILNY